MGRAWWRNHEHVDGSLNISGQMKPRTTVLIHGASSSVEDVARAVANLGMVMEETLEIWDVKEHFISYRLDPCPWDLRGGHV